MEIRVVPVTPFQQNCSVLVCPQTNKAAIVDPGGDVNRIYEAVAESGAQVEKILITHGHIDHAGATAEVAGHYGVEIEGPHRDEQELISAMKAQGSGFGLTGQTFQPNRWLTDGDEVTVGDQTLEVFHCPGHTLGHVIFYHPKQRFAIVGDVIFKGSIGRTDFPGGNHGQLISSIRDKLFPLGDDVRFLPGHGPVSTFGYERQHNPYVGDSVVG
ncbi:MAG: MBL fold metallo-hydrolase [bacterium]